MATKPATARKIEYPNKEVIIYATWNDDVGPLTQQLAKDLIGWETEEDYIARKKVEEPKSKKDWSFGENFHLRDNAGRKVMLWQNRGNRELDLTWAKKIAQDILNGAWKFNFENIIVSLYAQVLSGQHRLVAFILACEMWNLERNVTTGKWRDIWAEEPTLDVSIAFGADDSEDVRQTIDNVKTRSLSDVIYTSEFLTQAFKGDFAKMSLGDKGECSRMVSRALTTLWARTEAKKHYGLNTHSTVMAFLKNHKSLGDSLALLWKKDEERAISDDEKGIGIPSGMATALHYLMAASATDGDEYANAEPPTEREIDWEMWDKAEDFWVALAEKKATVYPAVEKAFKDRIHYTHGTPITQNERLHILAEAWKAFAKRGKVSLADIKLTEENYVEKDEVQHLKEIPSVGGIDSGETLLPTEKGDGKTPTPEQIEEEKKKLEKEKKAREMRTQKLDEAVKKNAAKGEEPEPEEEEESETGDDNDEEPVGDDDEETAPEEE